MKRSLPLAAAILLLIPARGLADDGLSLRPTLVSQLRLSSEHGIGSDATDPPAALELRRLRVGLRLSALDERLHATLVLNTSPSALELLDLWVEYRARRHLRVRVGQTKQPFTAYRLGSFYALHFVDWALVTRTFGGARQLGAELHNRGARSAWEYSVGIWNGVTVRAGHGREVADLYAQPVSNASDLRRYELPAALHPELSARAAFHHAGRARWSVGLNALLDLDPASRREFRATFAAEGSLHVGALYAQLTGYLGLSELTQSSGLGQSLGALMEVGVTAAERVTFAARYALVTREDALVDDARRALAQSSSSAQPGPETEQELGAAVDLRLPGVPVSANTDLAWLHQRVGGASRDGLRWRVQLQLVVP